MFITLFKILITENKAHDANAVFGWSIVMSCTMALGLTHPVTEMSTRNISLGVKAVGLITLPPSCADCLEIWEPQPPGTLWACPGL